MLAHPRWHVIISKGQHPPRSKQLSSSSRSNQFSPLLDLWSDNPSLLEVFPSLDSSLVSDPTPLKSPPPPFLSKLFAFHACAYLPSSRLVSSTSALLCPLPLVKPSGCHVIYPVCFLLLFPQSSLDHRFWRPFFKHNSLLPLYHRPSASGPIRLPISHSSLPLYPWLLTHSLSPLPPGLAFVALTSQPNPLFLSRPSRPLPLPFPSHLRWALLIPWTTLPLLLLLCWALLLRWALPLQWILFPYWATLTHWVLPLTFLLHLSPLLPHPSPYCLSLSHSWSLNPYLGFGLNEPTFLLVFLFPISLLAPPSQIPSGLSEATCPRPPSGLIFPPLPHPLGLHPPLSLFVLFGSFSPWFLSLCPLPFLSPICPLASPPHSSTPSHFPPPALL